MLKIVVSHRRSFFVLVSMKRMTVSVHGILLLLLTCKMKSAWYWISLPPYWILYIARTLLLNSVAEKKNKKRKKKQKIQGDSIYLLHSFHVFITYIWWFSNFNNPNLCRAGNESLASESCKGDLWKQVRRILTFSASSQSLKCHPCDWTY